MARISEKYPEEVRVHIGNRKNDGEAAPELASEYNVSRTTVYRYAKEAEAFQETRGAFQEFGVSGLNRFGGSVQEDYDRQWRTLTDMVPLVKEMLDHPTVGATAFAVEMTLRRSEWLVEPFKLPDVEEPAEQDLRAARFLEECIDDFSHTFDDHITQVVSMLWYGFAPFEIVYKRRLGADGPVESRFDDGRIGWRKFAFRAQDTLSPGDEWDIDENGGIQAMHQSAPPSYTPVTIPIEKLLLYRTTAAKNNPQGRSALRSAFISWWYSKNFSEIEGIAAERSGAGLPVMYLGKGTSTKGANSDFDFAKQVVRDTRADEQAGVVIPHPKMTSEGVGIEFELLSAPSRSMFDFHKTIERYNHQIAQTLLAQFIFLGLTEFGTQALVIELRDFFAEAVSGWLKTISNVLNRFAIPRLFRMNTFEGLGGLPQLVPGPVGEVDLEMITEAIERVVSSGAVTPDQGVEDEIRRLLSLPEAEETKGTPVNQGKNGKGNGNGSGEGEEEEFAALRGRGPGRRRTWEAATNSYQHELRDIYTTWARDLAVDIEEGETDGEREEILAAALLALQADLVLLGNRRIRDGVRLGLGDEFEMTAAVENAMTFQQFSNERYVKTSLMFDVRQRLNEALADPAVLALGAAGIVALLEKMTARVESYAGGMWGGITIGVGVGSQGKGLYWNRDPQAKHCFPAGTPVLLERGWCPIEDVRCDDMAITRQGPKRVSRLYRQHYRGDLVVVNGEVAATPNHPIWIAGGGWVRADALKVGHQVLSGEIRFPDSNHAVSTRFKIPVLRSVAALLSDLPFSKRFKSGMAVPPVAVNLNDGMPIFEHGIHNKFGLDKDILPMSDSKRRQEGKKPFFKFSRLALLKFTMPFHKSYEILFNYFWMFCAPFRQLRLHFGALGRIFVAEHIAPRRFVDAFAVFLGSKAQAMFSLLYRLMSRYMMETVFPSAATSIPTNNALSKASLLFGINSLPVTVVGLAAGQRTEAETRPSRGIPAPFALHLNSVAHLDTLYHDDTVYNLEVEDAHEYIAGGLLVHNCDDCLEFGERSYDSYDAMLTETGGLAPGIGVQCDGNCRCGLAAELVEASREYVRP